MADYKSWTCKLFIIISGSIFIDGKRSICGNLHLVQERGSIHSPNYPHPYPNTTNCTWTILSPPSSVVTLVVKDVDIEDDQECKSPPCCNNNVLILPQNYSVSVKKLCGHNLKLKPIQLSSHFETKIIFLASRHNIKSRGFLLSYYIESFSSVPMCQPNEFKCLNGNCILNGFQCDGIKHCEDGSDENSCKGITPHQFFDSSKNCMSPSLWCDGNFICDVKNEENCLKNSVISATIMGCLFCGLMLVIAMMCGLRLYTMHNDNSDCRIHLPAHIATRLSLTRYISLPELIEDDFFHREPPPSYSIAVGQTSENIAGISSNRGHRTRLWRQRSLMPIKPPSPPPSSETSNQSSPSRDSITSSSYLSNDENVRLVDPEN